MGVLVYGLCGTITHAVMVNEVDSPFDIYEIAEGEYIDEEKKYAIANQTDTSDMADLNRAFNNGMLTIEKELIADNRTNYTHIVKDTDGFLFAIILEKISQTAKL